MSVRLRGSHRVPLLLVVCLLAALGLPGACEERRVGIGASLLPTAQVLGQPAADEYATLREQLAQVLIENERLRGESAAVPDGPLGEFPAVEVDGSGSIERPLVRLAHVLHRSTSYERRAFVVDTGRDEGVRPGLPVTHGDSLVGLIRTAADGASQVVRVDDPGIPGLAVRVLPDPARKSRGPAPAEVRGDGEVIRSGVARGTGDGRIVVSFLPALAAQVGDLVVTEPRYPVPAGLVVGQVTRFEDDDRNGEWEAEIAPLRDLESFDSVLVILRPKLPPEVFSK